MGAVASIGPEGSAERRGAILDAAEQCFVLEGFHRTTMQDVARAAAMSVGNLYRYFPSKDAVVLALAERDRAEAARHFHSCHDAALWSTLAKLIRLHHVEMPRTKAVLLMEVWAEGTRNPTVAAMLAQFEEENQAWIVKALSESGALGPDDAAALAHRISLDLQGVTVSRALSPSYDPAPAIERLIAEVERRLDPCDRAIPPGEGSREMAA